MIYLVTVQSIDLIVIVIFTQNDFKDLKNYKKEVSIERKYVGVVVGKDHTVINSIIANSETQIYIPLREGK